MSHILLNWFQIESKFYVQAKKKRERAYKMTELIFTNIKVAKIGTHIENRSIISGTSALF